MLRSRRNTISTREESVPGIYQCVYKSRRGLYQYTANLSRLLSVSDSSTLATRLRRTSLSSSRFAR